MEKRSGMIYRQPRQVAARRWHYSCGSVHHKSAIGHTAFNQQWKCNGSYWHFGIFESMRKMGSSKSHNRARTSKESRLFWIVRAFWCWMGRLFCPGSSQVTKPGLAILSRRRKGRQWSGITHNHQEKRSSRQILSTGKVMITVLWYNDGVLLVDAMARGETINSDGWYAAQSWRQSFAHQRACRCCGGFRFVGSVFPYFVHPALPHCIFQ